MSEELTIEKLFRVDLFEIPTYQRAYSWEKQQWEQFIGDLREATDKYYLGHFLFETSQARLQVIDGQQRITTCMIFFRAVINVLKRMGKDAPRQYSNFIFDEIREMVVLKTVGYDNAYYRDLVVDNTERSMPSTKSQRNIKEGLKYFERTLSELSSEEILRIADLLSHATITRYTVTDKAMAAQVFAFQNDRGKDLSELEKIKSYFFLQIYLNSSGERQKDDVDYVDSQFSKIYEQIVRIKLHEDDTVNYYWRSRCQRGFAAGRALDEIKEDIAKTTDKNAWIKTFASELAATFQFVERFERDISNQYTVRLRQLNNLAFAYPFIIKANLLHIPYESPVFTRLLHFLENITFRAQLRGGRAELTNRLTAPLQMMEDEESVNNTISQMIEWLKNDDGYWGYWGNREMKRILGGYFYQNRADNYFFWQYELSRYTGGYGGPIEINYSDLVKDENIEHIAPRTENELPANGYGDYVDPVCPENGIESGEWINGIGNLMLISGSHNKSIGNCPFAEKLSSYEDLSLMKQQLEIKDFASVKDGELVWDLDAIKKRRAALIDAAMQIWSLEKI